jgi:hypothetical protein
MLVWTHDDPAMPGWYWLKLPDGTLGVMRIFDAHLPFSVEMHEAYSGAAWAGPIPLPVDLHLERR